MNSKQLYLFLVFAIFVLAIKSQAQTDSIPKGIKVQKYEPVSNTNVQKAAEYLSNSLSKNVKDEQIAEDYLNLAKELITKGEYAKAEEYLNKASELYGRTNKKSKRAVVNRELAKTQEMLGQYKQAIESYKAASDKEPANSMQQQINQNDAKRLENSSNPVIQSNIIRDNINLLEQKDTTKSNEKANAYVQMAETQLQMNQNKDALKSYESALKNVADKPNEALKIQRKIANVYITDEPSSNEGIKKLSDVYQMAISSKNTLEAKNTLEELVAVYQKKGDYPNAIAIYQDFISNLEKLIKTDSSLVDIKLFQSTEEKIRQLEKEKQLKDELISKKSLLNNVLIVSVILMLIFLVFIGKALYTIKINNKKIALQSLRREMNPHFIFNSLNSVNRFIAQRNELAANKFLASYSQLMRSMMENSNKDFIRLNQEIELLQKYLELESLRFGDKFSYEITIDPNIDSETVFIPGMLIQPHLENAIWHGLRYKQEKGWLKLSVSLHQQIITIIIDDNGIGFTKSLELKTQNQKKHQSRGLSNVNERIKLLNDLYKKQITIDAGEKESPETGVTVAIRLPLINNLK